MAEKYYYTNEEFSNKIKILENDIATLKNDIDLLKLQTAKLESCVLKMEKKELYDKYVIAIQDVNINKQLEKHVANLSTTKNLKKLRNSRVSTCHYLNEDDYDTTMLDDKLAFLYDKINKMPTDIKNKFDKQYPNLISDIVGHIPSKKSVTSIFPTNLEDIVNWWEK
jgi:DNA repair ATPase RecN